MTNSKSTYPQEWIVQDSIPMTTSLLRDSEENVYLERSGKKNETKIIELQRKLDQAIESLRFYAFADIHKYHQDGGELSRKCLKEIEK